MLGVEHIKTYCSCRNMYHFGKPTELILLILFSSLFTQSLPQTYIVKVLPNLQNWILLGTIIASFFKFLFKYNLVVHANLKPDGKATSLNVCSR